MSYTYDFTARIEPYGEDAEAIAAAWNADDDLVSYVGPAQVIERPHPTYVEASGGESGNLDVVDIILHVTPISRRFPKALFRIISEGQNFGDFPNVTYIQAAQSYSQAFRVPPFEEWRLTPAPFSPELLIEQMTEEELFSGPHLHMSVEDMEPDIGDDAV